MTLQTEQLSKTVTCISCESSRCRELPEVYGYTYYRCLDCGTLSVSPVPDAVTLKDYYNSVYRVDPGQLESYGEATSHESHWYRQLNRLDRLVPKSDRSILEVGSSWGSFLAAAKLRGWSPSGSELSREAALWAKAHWQVPVHAGFLAESPFEKQSFDAVVFWHVLEHITDPVSFLKDAASFARPDGFVVFTTPNVSSLAAKLSGVHWEWATPPAHLHLFSREGIPHLLKQAGLEAVRLSTRQGDAMPFTASLAWATTKRLRLDRWLKKRLQQPTAVAGESTVQTPVGESRVAKATRLLHLLGRLSGSDLLRPAEKLFKAGPELFVVARKISWHA